MTWRSRRGNRGPWLYASLVGAIFLVTGATGQGQRPGKMPEFSEGFRAFKQEDWEEAAHQMHATLEIWPEDGELTRVYGRWFEPYLPHYYFGVALLELGCYEKALGQFKLTLLNVEDIKGARKQKEQLEALKLECEEFLRRGITERNGSGCGSWGSGLDDLSGDGNHED